VRAVLRHVAVDFEREFEMAVAPFVGLAFGIGRKGVDEPLFVAESSWSQVFACYVCRAEDHAADDYDDVEALVADYAISGWREVTRVSLVACPPKTRRAAS
jgi:hypothetical protein